MDKFVSLQPDQTAVYQRHVISGMSGPTSFGHHAMLKFPDRPGCGRISTSRFLRGQVAPIPFEKPEARGYSSLRPGATFESFREVPMQTGELADLSRYPARRGFEDLVLLESDPGLPFAWTAVTFSEEGYVWFALKNPRVLRQTILWISNGGRHYSPWNGRHVGVLGLEEVTSSLFGGDLSPSNVARQTNSESGLSAAAPTRRSTRRCLADQSAKQAKRRACSRFFARPMRQRQQAARTPNASRLPIHPARQQPPFFG